MHTQAFAPANISFIFKIHDDPDPRRKGSFGVGATLNKGVTVTAKKTEKTAITYNGEQIKFPAVTFVLKKLTAQHLSISIESPFPLGSGFGMSGASALATAYAVNELLHLEKSPKELALLAHTADVVNKTGLGDVVNQYFGGCLLKTQPSSDFVVENLPLVNCKVYCQSISKLSTAMILQNNDIHAVITHAADRALQEIKKEETAITLAKLLTFAKQFAEESTLLQNADVKKIIDQIENNDGHASMIMLGNGIVSDIPFKDATEYTISDTPAHLL